jgi:anti-sigma-K factor RskA
MKKIDTILDEMLAKTREMPADDRVPYAFEKRIMAHIKEAPEASANLWELWGHSLWRAVVPCLAVMALVAVWMKAPGETTGTTGPNTGAPTVATVDSPAKEDLESIVMFAIDPQPNE